MRAMGKDGKMYGSQKEAFDSGQTQDAPSDDSQQPQSIEDNPKAMQLVDELKQMGYSADDVAQAMQDDTDTQQSGGQAATAAAPLQIPGM